MRISKVFVVAPANYKTGGTELLHQLVKKLNDYDCPATIAYTDVQENIDPINDAFKIYTNNYIAYEDICDDFDSVVIVPEVFTNYLKRFKKAKKIIWWLSVDNFEINCGIKGSLKHRGLLRTIKRIITGKLENRFNTIKYGDIHLYQSEYARLYLSSLGFNDVLPLSDYVNDLFFQYDHKDERCDYVLFNPKKGYSFTKKIIKRFPEFKWKSIEKMTTEEVVSLLHRSKVYIDFGNHPGKDRFPREAAISGCCVITGLRGSANNDLDVMIPSCYKYEDSNGSIPEIGKKIEYCVHYYEEAIMDFEVYRRKISKEKSIFMSEVRNLITFLKSL